jgi:acetate kinase
MDVLVINCGSSSIKAAVIEHESGQRKAALKIERLGADDGETQLRFLGDEDATTIDAGDHQAALRVALPRLLERLGDDADIAGVGHRVVHGGERFSEPTQIDEAVDAAIEELSALAPLHNPPNLAGIRAARLLLTEVPHVAVFDTAFHATLPRRARTYAIPTEVADETGTRRYGFHGTSHAFVARRAAAFLGDDARNLRIITCHLGNGASVAAVEYGRSVETSMGMTPLEGLVMGTRSGDVDPGVLIHLMREKGLDADGLDELLNRNSGLSGLSGVGNDMRDIEERAAAGDERCRLALHVFCHRLRKYVGAYAAVMGGVDVIAFTGGIGENSALVRHRTAQRLDFLGAQLSEDRNRHAKLSADEPVVEVSAEHSRVRILAVGTDEEHEIAKQTAAIVSERQKVSGERPIPIAVSARHVHLTPEMVEMLFGKGHELTPYRPLSQPGQFACEEKVDLIGPKRNIEGVRILGPTRSKNQVEISRTDEFWLGIDAPVRRSGDVENTPGITLRGPNGTVTLMEGVICAWRHIHMTPGDAEHYGVEHLDVVEVAIGGGPRDLVFGDVTIRVSPKYALEMHIDTDEANAAELSSKSEGMLVATDGTATLRRRRVG